MYKESYQPSSRDWKAVVVCSKLIQSIKLSTTKIQNVVREDTNRCEL